MSENRIDRVISGALKSCIDTHGPITPNLLDSASKRVRSSLRGAGFFREAPPYAEPLCPSCGANLKVRPHSFRCRDCNKVFEAVERLREYIEHDYFKEEAAPTTAHGTTQPIIELESDSERTKDRLTEKESTNTG